MPRSKAIHHYPRQYGEIVEGCALRGERLTIATATRLEAAKLRGHFYAYVGALRRTALEIELRAGERRLTAGEEEIINRARQSEMVLVMVQDLPDGTAEIAFCNREESWQARMLARGQLTTVSPQPASAKEDAMLERLLAVQAAVDKEKGK